jgi:hypothetical protein
VKITFVTVNFEVSARTKRTVLHVVLPATVLLGAGGIAYASLPHTFASGEVLTAANLNNDLQSLDTRLTTLEGHEDETSGTRIAARFTTTTSTSADGAQQVTKYFAGWFDTQRNEPCSVMLASDGQQRCMPEAAFVNGDAFSDAACTKPVIEVDLDSACTSDPTCSACNPPAPKYFAKGFPSSCGGTQIFPAGAQLPLTTYYLGSPSFCSMEGVPANALFYDASSTAEITPSSFAAFTVTSQTQ